MLYGAPAGSIQKLQCLQITAARIVVHTEVTCSAASGTVPLAASPPADRLQAGHTNTQDLCHIHTILLQRSHQILGVYTSTPFIHRATTSKDRLRENILPTTLSDVVHLLSGTRILKDYTVALLVDLNADLKYCFSARHSVARLELSASASDVIRHAGAI